VDDNVGPARGRPAQGVRHSKRLLVDAHDDLGLGIEEGGAHACKRVPARHLGRRQVVTGGL
jgi:hypothetical protein